MNTIISSLSAYFSACPLMEGKKINIDFLPEGGEVEYSIDPIPEAQTLKQYTDGSSIRQYLFAIDSVMDYGAGALQNMANSGFFEQLSAWLEEQTKVGNLPELPQGMEAQSVLAQSTGTLLEAGADVGKYRIQCKLQYFCPPAGTGQA